MDWDNSQRQLRFHQDGTFRLIQIADLHSSVNDPVTRDVIARALRYHSPDLIVFTGDNFVMSLRNEADIERAASSFQALVGEIPYAMTFGNHDGEYNETPIEQQYRVFLRYGALDFETPELSDCATGNLYLYSSDGSRALWDLVLINSGTYDPTGGYGKAGYNQVPHAQAERSENEERYREVVRWIGKHNDDQRRMTPDHELLPTLAFQHIPLQEFYNTGILRPAEADEPEALKPISTLKGAEFYRPNRENPTVKGVYGETAAASASSTLLQYLAMAKEGNYKGVFYGHDHINSLEGLGVLTYEGREYSLYQGYGWCPSNEKYSPADKGVRAFTLFADGHYETEILFASRIP